jgi:hypothetical protein
MAARTAERFLVPVFLKFRRETYAVSFLKEFFMQTYLSSSAIILSLSVLGSAAIAQGTTETVKFDLSASQPSLFDSDRQDVFTGSVDDRSGTTQFEVTCSAGASAWLGLSRIDEACAVNGSGVIKNPNNPAQTLPRLNYMGGFTIQAASDGYTDATTILANYLRAGSAGAENKAFGGNVIMKPENPSASAIALGERLVQNLQETAAGTETVEFSTEIDSIRFENFTIPHVGQATSESCSWTGDAIFAYANFAWQMEFDVKCGDQSFRLEGNMPLIDAPDGSSHQQEYAINLVLPGASGGDPFAAADPFAVVDGLTGVLRMSNAGRSTEDGVYENVSVEGELVGNGVPLELVRGYGQILSVFGRTFFGA